MKVIDVVWYFDRASEIWPNYRDGVRAAMEEIEKRGHTVRWHFGKNVVIEDDSDFILVWDNSTSEFIQEFHKYKGIKKGLILTTDLGMDLDSLRHYDVIFPETLPIKETLRANGIKAIKAFGTDTEFFKPDDREKVYEAFYPATFSLWKRQNLFADIYGNEGICCGTIQPDGWNIFNHVIEKGTGVYVGYLPVSEVRELYGKSKKAHITGWEGSGRTVIEALSMGLEVEVSMDNHKCQSYLQEYRSSGLGPREFAKMYYSAEVYADQLLKGIEE